MVHPLQGAQVGLVTIPVSDFEAACTFYRDVLGLHEDFAIEEYAWAQYATGTIPLCLYVPGRGGGQASPGGDTGIQLRIEDAAAAYELLAPHCDGELRRGDDGSINFVLRDPDGNRIQVLQLG